MTPLENKAGSERRKYLRVIPDHRYPVRVDINGANFIDILYAVDISEGGLGVRVNHRFTGCDLGESISFIIDIPLPRHVLLHGAGKIRHISGDHFGIVFNPLPPQLRAHIRNYIALQVREKSRWSWFQYKLGLIT
jgi:hypothetical protein